MIDGIHLHKVLEQLIPLLIGGRIEKVYHPKNKLLIFKIRFQNSKYNRLAISLEPSFSSIHPTTLNYENPAIPSTFCMLLRKHLEGSVITAVRQMGHERLIDIDVEGYNELGIKGPKTLHLELMGKYGNVILTENNLILDALFKYPIGVNGFREILPRRSYDFPPLTNKICINDLTPHELESLVGSVDPEMVLLPFLQSILQGFSKKSLKKILEKHHRVDVPISVLTQESLFDLIQVIKGEALLPDVGILEWTDEQFNANFNEDLTLSLQRKLQSILEKHQRKLAKKAAIYHEKIRLSLDSDALRIKGELLSANLYHLKGNLKQVVVDNYYDKNLTPQLIELDESVSPTVNVKRYFKRYHKAQEGKKQSEKLLEGLVVEMDYLESIHLSIEKAPSMVDLLEIQDEMVLKGLLMLPNKKKKNNSTLNFLSKTLLDGSILYVGKNNRQNDLITFKVAGNNDYWFHVKDAPGPHVILNSKGQEPTPETLVEAAKYAAMDPKTGTVADVLVDYTKKRHLRRHPSLLPGKVIYSQYQTVHVKGED